MAGQLSTSTSGERFLRRTSSRPRISTSISPDTAAQGKYNHILKTFAKKYFQPKLFPFITEPVPVLSPIQCRTTNQSGITSYLCGWIWIYAAWLPLQQRHLLLPLILFVHDTIAMFSWSKKWLTFVIFPSMQFQSWPDEQFIKTSQYTDLLL